MAFSQYLNFTIPQKNSKFLTNFVASLENMNFTGKIEITFLTFSQIYTITRAILTTIFEEIWTPIFFEDLNQSEKLSELKPPFCHIERMRSSNFNRWPLFLRRGAAVLKYSFFLQGYLVDLLTSREPCEKFWLLP